MPLFRRQAPPSHQHDAMTYHIHRHCVLVAVRVRDLDYLTYAVMVGWTFVTACHVFLALCGMSHGRHRH